jgi:subtilase family serine protease
MRSAMKAVVAVSVALSTLGAVGQEAGGTKGVAAEAASEATPQAGYVFVPESSKEQPGRVHTTYVLRSFDGKQPAGLTAPMSLGTVAPAGTTEEAETPQSLGCLYVSSPASAGCVPNYNSGSGGPSAAGYGAIALVDAYDNPDAATDLQAFDSYWGLPAATFVKVYANGNGDCAKPAANSGWSVESSMDIEYAHVFAPSAAIILVEACSSSYTDLFYAEQVAFNYIVTNYKTGGQVSNSWQGGEFSGQIADDSLFADFNYNFATDYSTPILAFASSGDGGYGVGYPSTNPWVISAGGTSILRNASTLKVSSESCWGGSGGGPSTVEKYTTTWSGGNVGPWADFQYPIFGQGSFRRTPDFSFDADPASGAWVYSAYGIGGWGVVGGTSLASPALAGIVNRAGNKLGSVFLTPATGGADWFSTWENNLLYAQLATAKAYKSNFYDVKTGSNGVSATASWDYCTGVGSPRGLLGK